MERTDTSGGFKKCPNCGFVWDTRDRFLSDPKIEVIGYQADFNQLGSGLLYFNHDCRGTLAICAGYFGDLYDGPVFSDRATGSEECPGYCLHKEELAPCPARCECSYVREIIQIIKKHNKPLRRAPKTDSVQAEVKRRHKGVYGSI